MNIATQLSNTHKAYLEIERLVDSLTDNQYQFCMHYHYDLLVISAWPREENSNNAIRFTIDGFNVTKKEGGLFYTDIQIAEMKSIVENWLSSALHVNSDSNEQTH